MDIEDLDPEETPLSEQEAANVKGGAYEGYLKLNTASPQLSSYSQPADSFSLNYTKTSFHK